MIRSDLNVNLHLMSLEQVEQLKQVDKKILTILSVDTEKLTIIAGSDNRNAELKEWWWHLDKVNSGELLIDIEGGAVNHCL